MHLMERVQIFEMLRAAGFVASTCSSLGNHLFIAILAWKAGHLPLAERIKRRRLPWRLHLLEFAKRFQGVALAAVKVSRMVVEGSRRI